MATGSEDKTMDRFWLLVKKSTHKNNKKQNTKTPDAGTSTILKNNPYFCQ
jgi:hypothetical protein